MAEHTRESLIEKARELALHQNNPLTRDEFIKLTGISRYFIEVLFPDGGWRELADLAGIEPHPSAHGRFSNEDLLAAYHSVAKETIKTGKLPSRSQIKARTKFSYNAILRRFEHSIAVFLKAYKEWLTKNDPDSPCVELVTTKSKHEPLDVPKTSQVDGVDPSHGWSKGNGVVYGAPLNFRGLRHAPVNEQGVVYLFGMVAYELGLMVESVRKTFPDCEAKRCVDPLRNHWQRVLIEFEHLSSNFKAHDHDVKGCHMIVCWEHDWPDCPLEVIELRSVIDKLEA